MEVAFNCSLFDVHDTEFIHLVSFATSNKTLSVMKFFKKLTNNNQNNNIDETVKASFDYFGSSEVIANRHIHNAEHGVLNKYAQGELTCSRVELDVILNKEVICENATDKYKVVESDLNLVDADWFPRLLKLTKPTEKDEDGISRTSSEGVSSVRIIVHGNVGV